MEAVLERETDEATALMSSPEPPVIDAAAPPAPAVTVTYSIEVVVVVVVELSVHVLLAPISGATSVLEAATWPRPASAGLEKAASAALDVAGKGWTVTLRTGIDDAEPAPVSLELLPGMVPLMGNGLPVELGIG